MKIGIIGAGNVGGALGAAWVKAGHEVMYGARDRNSEKLQKAIGAVGAAVKVGSPAEAAAFGEAILLAVPWSETLKTVSELGNLNGKILIDAINTFHADPPQRGSCAQDIAAGAPGARVVKAFNTMGAATMADPDFNAQKATVFIAGDDADAKATVMKLASDIGLDALDAGPLENAAHLEAMGKLWVHLAYTAGMGAGIAYKLVRR
jgi:NADPH-dependent F420 reductase